MQKITPFIWFNNQAEEAANFYISIFRNSKMAGITRYGEGAPVPKGTVMTVSFLLDGQEFSAINGGPYYTITPAISFVVNCATQAEVDEYWQKLSEGGEKQKCGWLKDKFGVSWQIIPVALFKMLNDPDPAKSQRMMAAMFKMDKIDIKSLERAYENRE